jgi:C1A family cysteine protease
MNVPYMYQLTSSLLLLYLLFSTYGRDGCGGGWSSTAWDYVTRVGGITFADYYPYDLSASLSCDATKNDYTVTVSNWYEMDGELDGEKQMIDYVLSKGTLSVAVDATLWGSYRGGIFNSCSGKPISLNHGVNIVGVNTVERYWIIRNSWGTWWGENGYMKLAMVSLSIRAVRQLALARLCAVATISY